MSRKDGRKLENWLKGLLQYVEETESPREFWLWSGIFTLASALQRRVWIPFGLDNIYPNLYVLLVAPPGKCRKGSPVSLSKKLLQEIRIPVSADSTSKRALTQELVEISEGQVFNYKGKLRPQAPLAIISKEMSSLLALDPKGMIEALTDLFDSHDEWKYKTSSQGHDFLYGVCVSCLIATTPNWLANNLPQGAIGGGYTSRHVILCGYEKYKRVAIPPPPDVKIYEKLIHDLNKVAQLVGQFRWGEGAEDFFIDWYNSLDDLIKRTPDTRLHGYIERIHIIALKVAMALRVSYSSELVLSPNDLGRAIDLATEALSSASDALGGHGQSHLGPKTVEVERQIKAKGRMTLKELLLANYRDISLPELREILESLQAMNKIKLVFSSRGDQIAVYNK